MISSNFKGFKKKIPFYYPGFCAFQNMVCMICIKIYFSRYYLKNEYIYWSIYLFIIEVYDKMCWGVRGIKNESDREGSNLNLKQTLYLCRFMILTETGGNSKFFVTKNSTVLYLERNWVFVTSSNFLIHIS